MTVNSALQSKLDRRKYWLRKNSITDYAEKMFQKATLENYGQTAMPKWDDQASKHQCYKKNQNDCQWKSIFWKWNFLERTYRNTHKTRTFSLPAAMLEKSEMIWKSFMFNLKKGTLKFLKKLYKFCKPSVSFKAMCENLSSLAMLSSYHIFRKRKTLDWDQETHVSGNHLWITKLYPC